MKKINLWVHPFQWTFIPSTIQRSEYPEIYSNKEYTFLCFTLNLAKGDPEKAYQAKRESLIRH